MNYYIQITTPDAESKIRIPEVEGEITPEKVVEAFTLAFACVGFDEADMLEGFMEHSRGD